VRWVASARLVMALLALMYGGAQAQQPEGQGTVPSALSKENLARSRPAAPVNLTGTYTFKVEGSDADSHNFLPLPKLKPAAQAVYDKIKKYRAKGFDYLDNAGRCWPLGVPEIMTRYWPIQLVQLPTMVLVVAMVNNDVRWIYTDGRQHPAAEDLEPTYNGHSIGHWEGKTLVVDTVGFTDVRHFVSDGVPSGERLHIVERFSLSADGNTLQDEFTMTDPDNWVGQWRDTKHYSRQEFVDLRESKCIYEQEMKSPAFNKNLNE
jgi:hypothetical protein